MHQGVEIGGGAAVLKGLFEDGPVADKLWLNLAYTYSDFRFVDHPTYGDNRLPGQPEHVLRAELLYKHPTGVYAGPNVEWAPQGYYVDNYNTEAQAVDGYALLGAKLGFDNGGRFAAYIEGRNLTDETYISSANVASFANAASTLYFPGNGRSVYAGVKFRW
jgi:iron complex outermembrane receptor protein